MQKIITLINILKKINKFSQQVFMIVFKHSSKKNNSVEVYVINRNGEHTLDKHVHLIQKHYLHLIPQAFEECIFNNKLSFWRK